MNRVTSRRDTLNGCVSKPSKAAYLDSNIGVNSERAKQITHYDARKRRVLGIKTQPVFEKVTVKRRQMLSPTIKGYYQLKCTCINRVAED